jgi:acyl-CoA synthetase (NDP forming)
MKTLTEAETKALLARYDIPVTAGKITISIQEAIQTAEALGYPVVMKIASPDITHKTDAGGVILNIQNKKEATEAYKSILNNAKQYNPDAQIDGIYVQKMAPSGIETIIGVKQDPQFGKTLMFGLGGIFVEIYKDVSFRILPITPQDAEQMIREIKAYPLFHARGKHYDVEAVRGTLLKVATLAEKERITELDINPLIVHEHGVTAADARALVG